MTTQSAEFASQAINTPVTEPLWRRLLPMAVVGFVPLVGYWAVTRAGTLTPDTALIGAAVIVAILIGLFQRTQPVADTGDLIGHYRAFARRVSAGDLTA